LTKLLAWSGFGLTQFPVRGSIDLSQLPIGKGYLVIVIMSNVLKYAIIFEMNEHKFWRETQKRNRKRD
jgi:hypothetical protein